MAGGGAEQLSVEGNRNVPSPGRRPPQHRPRPPGLPRDDGRLHRRQDALVSKPDGGRRGCPQPGLSRRPGGALPAEVRGLVVQPAVGGVPRILRQGWVDDSAHARGRGMEPSVGG